MLVCFKTGLPCAGAVWGKLQNFKTQRPAGGIRSLGWNLEVIALSCMVPLFLDQRKHEEAAPSTATTLEKADLAS